MPGAEPPEVFGLAIATHGSGQIYRFSCDHAWETLQNAVYGFVDEAKDALPEPCREVEAWGQTVAPPGPA